ncbi:hypothetical protein [Demequina maris]|uniref:hypothetical protein n=1 Tax=Demequina maris TaxID=1638982 RepID=UPI00078271AE|nr:hypothetical protein [Demequina maris]
MSVGALSAVVTLAALALGTVAGSRRALPWWAAALALVALGPIAYAPYAPLASLWFVVTTPALTAVALAAVGVALGLAARATLRAWRAEHDALAAGCRAAVLAAVAVVVLAVRRRRVSPVRLASAAAP